MRLTHDGEGWISFEKTTSPTHYGKKGIRETLDIERGEDGSIDVTISTTDEKYPTFGEMSAIMLPKHHAEALQRWFENLA